MATKTNISIFTFSCCNPSLKPMDEKYIAEIKQVLNSLNIEANIDLVTATEAYYGKKLGNLEKLKPIFNKYGMDAMPALFINGELTLYGGIPSTEKLTEVIQKAVNQKTMKT
jgi:hypothetical protein